MTNEQLAVLAQDPNNKELVPVLWDKVKNLLYMKANSAYRQYKSIFTQCGIELSDIRQSCYCIAYVRLCEVFCLLRYGISLLKIKRLTEQF